MAKLAASGYETQISADGESYIEKYIKSVAAVESIITLDRLGQVGSMCVLKTTHKLDGEYQLIIHVRKIRFKFGRTSCNVRFRVVDLLLF